MTTKRCACGCPKLVRERRRKYATIACFHRAKPGRARVTEAAVVPRGHAAKTHCRNGHPYDAANTWRDKEGRRHCRECNRERHALRYAKKANSRRRGLAITLPVHARVKRAAQVSHESWWLLPQYLDRAVFQQEAARRHPSRYTAGDLRWDPLESTCRHASLSIL